MPPRVTPLAPASRTFYFRPPVLRFLDALPLDSVAPADAALFPRDFAGFVSSSTSSATALAVSVLLPRNFAGFGC